MPLKLEHVLSDEDLAIIGHIVVDPVAWAEHAHGDLQANPVRAKIEKYRNEYLAARAQLGPDYKNRAQRDEAERERQAAELAGTAAPASSGYVG